MEQEALKKRIYEFIKRQRLAVISTVDEEHNKPEAACVAFAEKENLELIFGTMNMSRKYKNLQSNQNVSFVIGWSDEEGTVQYEGAAQELSGEEAIHHGEILAHKNENARAFLTKEAQRYFLVQPTWIRLVDKSVRPEERIELTFN